MRSCSRRRQAALAPLTLLLLLCLQARSQEVVEVSTAAALQTALAAGQRHIRVIDHIDGSTVNPQFQDADGSTALFLAFRETASITGACTSKPEGGNFTADWKPGMCLVHVPEGLAFLFPSPADVLWLDNLYIYLTGDVSPGQGRAGLYLDMRDQGASVYLTSISIETYPEHDDDVDSISPLVVLGESGRFELLLAGSSIVANDANIKATALEHPGALSQFHAAVDQQLPNNATVSLLDTNYLNIGSQRIFLVFFSTDLRIENCTFATRPYAVDRELAFDGRDETMARHVYKDDPSIVVHSLMEQGKPDNFVLEETLAMASAEAREANGFSPFLTLEDPQLLALQAEVSGAPLEPSSAPAAVDPATAPAASPGPVEESASSIATPEAGGSEISAGTPLSSALAAGLTALIVTAAMIAGIL